MKKLTAILLALVLVLSLAACGAEENPNEDLVITRAPEEAADAPVQEDAEAPAAEEGIFTLTVEGVELVPGAAFDPAALGEAASVYEVPSCAIEGTDNVYNYESFEITAYDDGTGEVIYSIYFLDPNMTTTEGLALGDDAARVTELYGENYVEEGTAFVYTRTSSQLYVIVENGAVTSIEYRMVVA